MKSRKNDRLFLNVMIFRIRTGSLPMRRGLLLKMENQIRQVIKNTR